MEGFSVAQPHLYGVGGWVVHSHSFLRVNAFQKAKELMVWDTSNLKSQLFCLASALLVDSSLLNTCSWREFQNVVIFFLIRKEEN